MADDLGIKRAWFHKNNHYDIPKRRVAEIQAKCTIVSSKEIVKIIKNVDIPSESGYNDIINQRKQNEH